LKQIEIIVNENGVVTSVRGIESEPEKNICITSYVLTKELREKRSNKYTYEVSITTFSQTKKNPRLKRGSLDNQKKVEVKKKTLERPKPAKRKRTVPQYMQPFIDYWDEKGTMKHVDTSTNTYRKIIQTLKKLLRGTMYNEVDIYKKYRDHPFTFLEFKKAVDRLNLAATNPLVLPRNKKIVRLSLPAFLFNEYGFDKMSMSYFLFFLENEPERTVAKDDALTTELIRKYTLNVLGGANARISAIDHDKFSASSSSLRSFFENNKSKISPNFTVSTKRMANWLWNAIYADVGDSMTISPGFFSSNRTFEFRLPSYLKKQAILLAAPKKKSLTQLNRERREK